MAEDVADFVRSVDNTRYNTVDTFPVFSSSVGSVVDFDFPHTRNLTVRRKVFNWKRTGASR